MSEAREKVTKPFADYHLVLEIDLTDAYKTIIQEDVKLLRRMKEIEETIYDDSLKPAQKVKRLKLLLNPWVGESRRDWASIFGYHPAIFANDVSGCVVDKDEYPEPPYYPITDEVMMEQ